MPYKKYLTIGEAMALLEETDSEDEEAQAIQAAKNVNVVYIPSDVDVISDTEELDDEIIQIDDENGTLHKDIAGEVEIEYDAEDEKDDTLTGEPSSKRQRIENDYKKLTEFDSPAWRKRLFKFSKEPVNIENEQVRNVIEKISGKTPYELFSLFCDDEVIDMIIEQTILYASQDNQTLCLEAYELRRFIGFLFFTGYHTLPIWKRYWSNSPSFGVDIVKKAFPRLRAETIKKFLHFVDNTKLDKSDKFTKIKPLVDLANKKFMQFGVFSHHVSIDEQMIPYFGRHSCRMFIKGKPIRFGFKAWCMASSEGYLYQTMLYGGASTPHNKTIGLGADTIMSLLKHIESPSCHRIYFDNFFSSYHLFCLLNEHRFFATGTVRANRVGGATLSKKLKKGENETQYDPANEMLIIRWKDNADVNILTNHGTLEPFCNARRYNRSEKKYINVQVPQSIADYNVNMGGVDLHDNASANYRIRIRSKKWWWPLFTNLLGNMMVNAWKLHCLICKVEKKKRMTQLDFRASVVEVLMLSESVDDLDLEEPLTSGVNSPSADSFASIRSSSNHSLKATVHCIQRGEGGPKRCVVCHKHASFICGKCNIRLHSHCFENYSKHISKQK